MKKGFTLVELAIVIVIIGLLVTGVLQGRELIEQAKINNTISKIQGFNAAAGTFKAKYNQIPGDINNASMLGLNHAKNSNTVNVCSGDGTNPTATSGANGNGDGYLNSMGYIACENGGGTINKYAHPTSGAAGGEGFRGEIANFFVHLSNAQLVKEGFSQPSTSPNLSFAGQQFPTMSVGSGMIVLTEGSLHYWVLGTPFNQPANSIASFFGNSLTPAQAFSVDLKMDDSNPTTGQVKAVSGLDTNSNFVNAAPGAATCVFTGGTYNIGGATADAKLCTLRVQANF